MMRKKLLFAAFMVGLGLDAGFARAEETGQAENVQLQDDLDAGQETLSYVGIRGYVRKLLDEELLVESAAEEFPGSFTVVGAETLPEYGRLKEGTFIQLFLQELTQTDEQGRAKYRAESLVVLEEEEGETPGGTVLTSAPAFTLSDVLSSQMNFCELRSGNYTWYTEESGEMMGIVACGAAPLEEAASDFAAKLKVPHDQDMDGACYSFSTEVAPDILTVSQWDVENIGQADAPKQAVTIYYYSSPLLDLEPGKVYEFTPEWTEKNADKNGFYGEAAYVLVTE